MSDTKKYLLIAGGAIAVGNYQLTQL